MADDLNVRNPVWNSQVSNPSGKKFSTLLVNSDFQISAHQSKYVCQMSLSLMSWT